jgi:hypothetical protein
MHTGTLIRDLFAAVEQAQGSDAAPRVANPPLSFPELLEQELTATGETVDSQPEQFP